MQRISSANYPPTRLILPKLSALRRPSVQVVIAGIIVLAAYSGLWLLFLPLLAMAILFAAIHYAPNLVFHNFCHDVWLGEDELVLQFKENTIRIPFAQVQSITWHGYNNPPRARIVLKSPTSPGPTFTFVPDLAHGRSIAKTNIESLQNHINHKIPAEP